jgi:hypothetical protein
MLYKVYSIATQKYKLDGTMKTKEKARCILTKTVNALTSKTEIGGPMALLYLLGNPDHYASHKLVTVYWKNSVQEILSHGHRRSARNNS